MQSLNQSAEVGGAGPRLGKRLGGPALMCSPPSLPVDPIKHWLSHTRLMTLQIPQKNPGTSTSEIGFQRGQFRGTGLLGFILCQYTSGFHGQCVKGPKTLNQIKAFLVQSENPNHAIACKRHKLWMAWVPFSVLLLGRGNWTIISHGFESEQDRVWEKPGHKNQHKI